MKEGIAAYVEKYSMVIATNFTFICCVYNSSNQGKSAGRQEDVINYQYDVNGRHLFGVEDVVGK